MSSETTESPSEKIDEPAQKEEAHSTLSELSIFETTAKLLSPQEVRVAMSAENKVVLEAVHDLLSALGSGDSQRVESSLLRLGVKHETELFQRVGHMARTLHNSLTDFKYSLDRGSVTMSTTCIPDAADKLEAVIKMTFEAAEKTLNLTDQQSDLIARTQSEIRLLRECIKNSEKAEIIQFTDEFLSRLDKRFNQMLEWNCDILMAQEFQDLTGQSLKKVIKLVTELEVNLVSMIKLFGGDVRPENSQEKAAVPVEAAKAPQDASLHQDDVDSILSSFGF